MAKIFIGIEGTGMRTSVAVAADASGKIIGTARQNYGMSLHTLPREVFQTRLERLLRQVASEAGRDLNNLTDACVCIGLTGVTFPYDAVVDLPREFDLLNIPVEKLICTGDSEIILASHARTGSGSVILSHMGSTAYVATGPSFSNRFRIGGWGPALGDEGSGFWMGRAALREIGREFEQGNHAHSVLWNCITEWLTSPHPEVLAWESAREEWSAFVSEFKSHGYTDFRPAIFNFAHKMFRESGADWREVASGLDIPVMQAAFNHSDNSALKIVNDAVKLLADQFLQALAISKIAVDPLPLVLYGGVLNHNPRFCELLLGQLKEKLQRPLKIIVPGNKNAMRPACGALLYALGGSTTKELHLPSTEVIENLTNDPELQKPDSNLRDE